MNTDCKICHWPASKPLPFDVPPEGGIWRRCVQCGSDSSSFTYEDSKSSYTAAYIDNHGMDSGNADRLEEQVLSNCEWFGHYSKGLPNRDFLDIGCCDGAALRVMARMGWSVHGFDVMEPPYMGPHVTVRPYFHRNWFPNRYAAVMAREVIEHVDSPSLFLHECHGVLVPGGLFQVQTPKPTDHYHPCIYQKEHLVILSQKSLRALLEDAMFEVLDFREWGGEDRQSGQAFLCKARG